MDGPSGKTDCKTHRFSRFQRFATGADAKGTRIDQAAFAMQKALAFNGPSLVEIMTDAEPV